MSRSLHRPGFLGRGWSFPPAFDLHAGGATMAEGEEDIRQCIGLLFAITPGQRQMLPQFGCNLARFAFVPFDVTVAAKIQAQVAAALLRYEPRIIVDAVLAAPGGEPGRRSIVITVQYTVRANNRRDNFVYPYLLNEATGLPG